MKISDLIALLQELLKTHGDLEVLYTNDDENVSLQGVRVLCTNLPKPFGVIKRLLLWSL
jgi:hypothetical protein